jgi:hypothetical protein
MPRPLLRLPASLTGLCVSGAALFLSSGPVQGQISEVFSLGETGSWAVQSAVIRSPNPGKAALFSGIVPGSGQWIHGQNRWAAYAAAELWAWIVFFDRRWEGKDVQRRYRDLAWHVARRVSMGPRTEGSWEYYEALTKYHSSGAFDSNPDLAGVQPEENPETFNGSVWVLAQEIFLAGSQGTPTDPDSSSYQNAYQYYLSRAYGPEFTWNWGTNDLYQGEYAELIRASDEDLRGSTTMLGVILANHLLSAVDALVSGRLGVVGVREPSMQFIFLPGPFNSYDVGFRVRLTLPGPHDS